MQGNGHEIVNIKKKLQGLCWFAVPEPPYHSQNFQKSFRLTDQWTEHKDHL